MGILGEPITLRQRFRQRFGLDWNFKEYDAAYVEHFRAGGGRVLSLCPSLCRNVSKGNGAGLPNNLY